MLAGRLTRAIFFKRPVYRLLAGFARIKLDSSSMEILKITDMDIHESTKDLLTGRGFTELFPVQFATYQDVSKGIDIIAKDKTGSGKTLAYALPLTERLRRERKEAEDESAMRKPKVLVMLPTRELALQVSAEFEKLSHSHDDHITAAFYGGTSFGVQQRIAKNGIDVLVATPGRLQDHINRGTIDLSEIETVVLDETDEMLEIGFKDAIFQILKDVRDAASVNGRRIQYLLFSATMPKWVKNTANEFLSKDYKIVDMVGSEEIATPKNIKHLMYKVDYEKDILESLNALVDTYAGMEGKCIIFTNTKREADNIISGRYIRASAKALHGDITQPEREAIFRNFKEGDLQVLVATNVAARGVDFPKVDLVIQVKPPNDVESFVHRSGRTGRAGKNGTCILVYDQTSQMLVKQLENVAKIKFQALTSSEIGAMQIKASDTFRRYVSKSLGEITDEQMNECSDLINELIQQHGESESLRRLVAYVTMNPIERSNLRPKSKYATGGSEGGRSAGNDYGSRDSYGGENRRAPRDNYGEENRRSPRENFGEDNRRGSRGNFGQENSEGSRSGAYGAPASNTIPSDLSKSIFVSGIESKEQVDSLQQQLGARGINIDFEFVRMPVPNSDKRGFAFVTPATAEDFTNIIDLKTLRIDGTDVKFRAKVD